MTLDGAPVLLGQAKAAVEHRGGHIQLIASAGSGKTEVVAQRAAALVAEGVAPSAIVAFTFTKRAAAELKERIRARVEAAAGETAVDLLGQMFVGTIHAYCFRLLQAYVPRYESYDPLDENQLAAFLQRETYRLGLPELVGAGQFASIEAFARSVDVIENEMLDVAALAEPFRSAATGYYDALERYKLLSYGLQIVRAVEALGDTQVHSRVSADVRHLIVDEYQDVNPAQERLIRLLAKPIGQADLAVVGDDDQAIYQWRGSDVRNIVTFIDRYPAVATFALTDNRRSRPGIVVLADAFARSIPGRLPKTMGAVREAEGPSVDIVTDYPTEVAEAEGVAERLRQLHERGVPYRAMAVLVRGRAAYPRLIEAFEEAGLPIQPGGRVGLFIQPEASALGMTYAWLGDRWWRAGRYSGSQQSVELEGLLLSHAQAFQLDSARVSVLRRHLQAWKRRVPDESGPVDLIGDYYELLALLGASTWNVSDTAMRNRLGTLARFSTILADYEAVKRRARPDSQVRGEQVGGEDRGEWYYRNFASLLANYANGAYEGFDGEPDLDVDAVDLTTVHGAKGLEWPIVFIPSLTARRFPSSKNGSPQNWLLSRDIFAADRYEGSDADERRLFYVALTRARDWVSLSTHERVNVQRAKPSPYLTESIALVSGMTGDLERPAPLVDKAIEDIVLTYSELQSFIDCGYAYRLRTSIGFMPALAPELGYGKAVHHLLRTVAEATQATGVTPDAAAVERLLASEFYLPYANKPAHREMRDAARRLVERYISSFGEELHRVWATERPFELSLDGIVVSGRADVIFDEHDGVPSHLAIVDYKTSTGPVVQPLQLQVYADAGRREGLDVAAAFVHDLKDATRHGVAIGAADVAAAENAVLVAAERLRQRDFVPNPNAERCRRCDVRALCGSAAPHRRS